MDRCLGKVLDDFLQGRLSKEQVLGGLVHVIAALDGGNRTEIETWLLSPENWGGAAD